MNKTPEQISLDLGKRIYQFGVGPEQWFCGTVEDCDNCFGLRVDATERDVLDFARNQNTTVLIYENGKLIEKIEQLA